MVEIKDKLEAIEFFIAKTNVNYNSTTLWHGIDDILKGYIPDFFLDNLNFYKIGEFIRKGFQVKPEENPKDIVHCSDSKCCGGHVKRN